MGDLTYAEKADMQYMNDRTNGNGRAALRMYQTRFRDRRMPDHIIFQQCAHLPECHGHLKNLVYDTPQTRISLLEYPKLLHECVKYLTSLNVSANRSTDAVKEFDIAHSVVSRLWKSFKTTGMCSGWHRGGRVRNMTPAEDRYSVLSAKRNRRTTAQHVANQFLAASGKQISRKTVARRLSGGLYARRPVVCVPLTRQHRTARLQWCREHYN
ncbi:transposable element Tcb1 transposase [Trichonephila clavipes]|nr:transposable element Tcb1 transposase [Trichonephila clavipes]